MKAKEEDGDCQVVFNQLCLQEQQRQASRQLKQMTGKTRQLKQMTGKTFQGRLTKLSVKDKQGHIHELTKQEDMENEVHNKNCDKFSQTNNTPPMMAPLVQDLGFTGISIACQEILQGTYTPHPYVDPYMKEYLKELATPNYLKNKPLPILETDKYVSGWGKMNEYTAAGLTHIHFGHMKASSKYPDLVAFEATLGHIPYVSGYLPSKWQTSINSLFE